MSHMAVKPKADTVHILDNMAHMQQMLNMSFFFSFFFF